MTTLDELKLVLREADIPFYTDEELEYYLSKHNGSFNDTAYECLIVKSENTALNLAGLTIADSSAYFRRLADRYRPRHSGVLKSV
ncbi:MAG: hypothetical protein J6M44_15475 [Butyrivibrio sp.]|jgi:hypothetical protein|nr:hypothetical protein [Butyrivibrio sp.]